MVEEGGRGLGRAPTPARKFFPAPFLCKITKILIFLK